MKAKQFKDYLQKRLDSDEIAEIKKQVALEHDILAALQQDVVQAIEQYMEKESIGFNELQRRLDISPTQVAKIKRGEANLTLASLAHIFALLQRRPRIIIK